MLRKVVKVIKRGKKTVSVNVLGERGNLERINVPVERYYGGVVEVAGGRYV